MQHGALVRYCRRSTVGLVLVLLPVVLSARQLPAEANLLWERESRKLVAADLAADSSDELLMYDADYYIIVRDQQLSVAGPSRNLDPGMEPAGRIDGNEQWAWAGARRNDSLFLVDLWQHRPLFVAAPLDRQAAPKWDVSIGPAMLVDIDADGEIEAVLTVLAGFCRRPRGLYVLDWRTGRREWVFEVGPTLEDFLLRDVDGDGKLEVLAGSAAPGNGNSASGTDDMHSYVFCLNCDGSARWVRQVGEYGQAVGVQWLERGAGTEPCLLAYETGCALDDAEPDSLFLLEPGTGAVVSTAQYGRLNRGCTVLAQPGKGASLVVLGNTDDTLRLLDARLRVVHKVALDGQGSIGLCAGSFSAQTRGEICVATTDGRIRLYDHELKPLAETRTMNVASLTAVRYRGKERLLVNTSPGGRMVWQLYDFSPVPLLSRRVPVGAVVGVVLVLVLAFVGVLLAWRYRQTRDLRLVVRSLTGQAGVIELDSRGAVVRANARGRELLTGVGAEPVKGRRLDRYGPLAVLAELVQAVQNDPVGARGRETVVSMGTVGGFLGRASRVRKGILLTLEEMTAVDYMRRARTWIPAAQRLAHSIKSPLSTIRLAAEQLPGDRARQAEHIVEQSERIRKMADAIMRLTSLELPRLVSHDLNRLVERVIEAMGLRLRPEVGLKLRLEPGLPQVRADENRFATALENLLDNAIAATKGRGSVSVTTRLTETENSAVVEVADDGPGIPKEDQDRVFQQFFTRKPEGTGLGLMLVKKIAEDHGARVELLSEVDKGTTVRITFPVQ